MKVLFAVWELPPFFKVGGLGDVARALPADLIMMGVDIAVVMPFYKAVRFGETNKKHTHTFHCTYNGKEEKVDIYKALHPLNNFPCFFLKNSIYLDVVIDQDTWPFFNKAIIEAIKGNFLSFTPDIIHCNDVHTGMLPLLIKEEKLPIKSLLTIHNLAHQGRVSKDVLSKLGINQEKGSILAWERETKQLNLLMEGIIHADVVTTVSPTYAREIMTEEYGIGLDEILRGKEGRVFGILNGINITRYLKHDSGKKCDFVRSRMDHPDQIAANLSYYLSKKKENKKLLQKKLGFEEKDDIPLTCFVGRFDAFQKGLDILHRMIRNLDLENHQFVILGSGNVDWEARFEWFNKFYPQNVYCNFTFNEGLAHEIYESSDFIVIPSKFEPCGLIQMLAMFFGTIPIAHRTGGLIDSIKNNHNGFLFEKYTSESLERVYRKAIDLRLHDSKTYDVMVMAALTADFSWKKSAAEYITLYEKLCSGEY